MRKIAILALVLALMCCGISVQAEFCRLQVYIGDELTDIAEISTPAGMHLVPEMASQGDTPEFYFIPDDSSKSVRFIYYTASEGDPRALAEAAQSSYAMFYDEFATSAIYEGNLSGHDGVSFYYTCQYPDSSGKSLIFEQTVVGYWLMENGCFIACIVSMSFDNGDDYLNETALMDELESAMENVTFR